MQLGELAFRTGDWETAESRYQAALAALPGWWSAREHLAELRGAQGRTEEAFQIYGEVIAVTPRPELLQAVGDLHLFLGQKEEAKAWHARALAAYREATSRGSVAWYHHLSGFYCDSEPDPVAALDAARKDLELRHSSAAFDALAWAQYQNGNGSDAAATMTQALASGIKDAHILYHAGLIRMSAGQLAEGQAALRDAAAVNPHFQSFHVHR
jgi:tetratricopeptide (TPR) repeat protein